MIPLAVAEKGGGRYSGELWDKNGERLGTRGAKGPLFSLNAK